MDLVIFLAGIAVLIGLGMVLAWPHDIDLTSDRRRAEPRRKSVQQSGKARGPRTKPHRGTVHG